MRWGIDASDQIEQCRLSASGWPGNGQEVTVFNAERNAIQCANALFPKSVVFENMLKPYYAHTLSKVRNQGLKSLLFCSDYWSQK